MSRVFKVIRNTGVLTLAKMLRPFLSIWLITHISHILGVGGLGRYTSIFSYLAIFEILSTFGLNTVLARDVAQNRALGLKYYYHGLILVLPIALCTFGAMNGWMWVLGKDAAFLAAVFVAAFSLIATAMNNCSEGVLLGMEEMPVVGWAWAVENFIRVLVSVLLLRSGYGLMALVAVYVVLRFFMFVYYFVQIRKRLAKIPFVFDRKFFFRLFNTAKIFVLIMIFVTVYWKADVIMLDHILGEEAVGFYNGGYRFYDIIHVVIGSFVLSIFPVLSEFYTTDKSSFVIASRKALKYFFMLALPGIVLLQFWAEPLVLFVMGPELLPSVRVLTILSLAIIPYGISEIFAYMLVASANQKIDLLVNGIGMLLNVLFNYFLIRRFQYYGAAAATVLSILLYLSIQTFFIRRKLLDLHFFDIARLLGVVGVAAGVMALGTWFLKAHHLLFLSVLLPLPYFYALWHFKVLSFEDKEMITRVAGRLVKVKRPGASP